MEIILGDRRSGKTTELIKRSAETGCYILVANKNEAINLFNQAKLMNLNIPYPVTVGEYLICNFRSSPIRRDGLLIDDFESVVGMIFSGIPINAVAISSDINYEVTNLNKEKKYENK